MSTKVQEMDNSYPYKFRTKTCTKKRGRYSKRCFYNHGNGMRRRAPEQHERGCFNYIPTHCQQWQKTKNCCLGDSCVRAHGWMEINFHPLFYKTKMCRSYLKNGVCFECGVYCAKAHNPTEILNLVNIYGEDWKYHFDLQMEEIGPDSMSIVESGRNCFKSQKTIVALPSKIQSDNNNLTDCLLDKPKSVTNLYTGQNQGEGSPLRIPKLASPIRRVESFENHSSYMTSPYLHGISECVRYHMPEFFLDPVETSNVDLYDETLEMYEGDTNFMMNCKSPAVKVPSECSLYSLPRISSPLGSSSSSTSNSGLCCLSLDHSEVCDISGSDESCTMDLKNSECGKENQPQSNHENSSHSLFERPNYDSIRKRLF